MHVICPKPKKLFLNFKPHKKLFFVSFLSKIRQVSGSLQKLFAGGSRPLGPKNYQEQGCGQAGSWFCCSFISQLRGAPSREDASSQDRGSLHCRTSGEQTLQSLSNPAVQVYELWWLTMTPEKTKPTKPKNKLL